MENPLKYFAELRGPRMERNREHLLEEILLIAIAAVLSGAESWNDIADYGETKRECLLSGLAGHTHFLPLRYYSIPSCASRGIAVLSFISSPDSECVIYDSPLFFAFHLFSISHHFYCACRTAVGRSHFASFLGFD